MAGAVLVAASVVAVTPIAPRPSEIPIASIETRLTDAGDSIFNIPFNLFQDFFNVPYYEVQALNAEASSLFFTGTWWNFDAVNLWGEDPGDPGHFMSLVDMLFPFPAISGLGSPEIDPIADAAGTAGLGQQLSLLAAAELPASSFCDAESCAPFFPVTPLTGSTTLDQAIWAALLFSGLYHFPLIDNLFKVPISELQSGYTFGTIVDPSGSANAEFGLPGTGPGDTMPWSDITFTLNLAAPFQNFYNSLLAPPDLSGFEFPSLTDVYHAFIAVLAGLVLDFNPFVPGSSWCPGSCDFASTLHLTNLDLVHNILALDPSNPLINEWLQRVQDGTANGATAAQIADMITNYQQPDSDGVGPLSADFNTLLTDVNTALSTDPNTLWADLSTADWSNPGTVFAEINTLLGGLGTTLSTDLNTLWADLQSLL